jgi:hypothetical protein
MDTSPYLFEFGRDWTEGVGTGRLHHHSPRRAAPRRPGMATKLLGPVPLRRFPAYNLPGTSTSPPSTERPSSDLDTPPGGALPPPPSLPPPGSQGPAAPPGSGGVACRGRERGPSGEPAGVQGISTAVGWDDMLPRAPWSGLFAHRALVPGVPRVREKNWTSSRGHGEEQLC